MRSGGKVEMNVWCSTVQEVEEVEMAFRDAGFSNVKGTGSGPGVMLRACPFRLTTSPPGVCSKMTTSGGDYVISPNWLPHR